MEFNTIAELKTNPSELKKVLVEHGYDRKAATFTALAIREGEVTLKEALERTNGVKDEEVLRSEWHYPRLCRAGKRC
jgi:hypothetical protein